MSGSAPGQVTGPISNAGGQSYVTDQWIRRWELVVYDPTSKGPGAGQALVLSQGSDVPGQEALRAKFDISNTMIPTPNVAVIRVYNPAPSTVTKVLNEFSRVTLAAGYVNGKFGTIFDGWITQFRFGGETPVDKFLELTAQDGDLAINQATINRVLLPGFNSPQSITEAIIQSMGTKGLSAQSDLNNLGYVGSSRPVVLYGAAADHAYVTQRTTDTVWSVQQGKLVVVPAVGANVANETIVANALTGLIGFPTLTNDGLEFRTLLNPFAKIGGFVRINNAEINQTLAGVGGNTSTFTSVLTAEGGLNYYASTSDDNTYLTANVGYKGDTRGQDWYTDYIGITVDPQTGNLTAAQELFPTLAQIKAQQGNN